MRLKRNQNTHFPMQSANVCGSSYDCFLLLSSGAISLDFICIGLYEISHKVAKAALAAAFFANFFDGPKYSSDLCNFGFT